MKRIASVLVFAGLLAGATSVGQAQQGFALKGHYLFNESTVDSREEGSIPENDGFSLGVEYVLPLGIGVGVTGYTTGDAREESLTSRTFGVLAEANYFFNLPIIPVTPYVGVHAGLGQYRVDDEEDADLRIRDDRNELGFQLGARLQVTSLLGIDAQYRRVSQSALGDQDERLDRNQFLVGVTLF